MHAHTLDRGSTALVVVDIQEAFRTAIPDCARIAERASIAVRGFQELGLPVIVTEQYPKGLGRTVEEISFVLNESSNVIEKSTFSSCGANAFVEALRSAGARQIVICGVETHVCVNQTAHDLLELGYQVQVLTDCVSSRFEHDKAAGLEKMKFSGVIPTSIEMAFFELMRDSRHEKFKAIQGLIK